MDITLPNLLLIAVTGFAASFYGAITGGGGLLTFPILIFLGISPQTAIACNRMGTLGFFIASLYKYQKGKVIKKKLAWNLVGIGMIGAFIGSVLVLQVDEALLQKVVAVFMLLVLALMIFKKDVGLAEVKDKTKWQKIIGYVAVFFLAIYGGFFGGGGGIVARYILVLAFGLTFLQAAGTSKLSALMSAIVSFVVFAYSGTINYVIGFALLVGYTLGGYFGASYALKKGNEVVRKILMVVVFVFAVKLLFF